METEFQIIVPKGFLGASDSDTSLDSAVRKIAELAYKISKPDDPVRAAWDSPDKYGAVFENETFFMSPDFQDAECNCGFRALADQWHADHPHGPQCYYTRYRKATEAWDAEHGWGDRPGLGGLRHVHGKWCSLQFSR